MGQLGDLLELLHAPPSGFERVRAEYRDWTHHARSQQAFRVETAETDAEGAIASAPLIGGGGAASPSADEPDLDRRGREDPPGDRAGRGRPGAAGEVRSAVVVVRPAERCPVGKRPGWGGRRRGRHPSAAAARPPTGGAALRAARTR